MKNESSLTNSLYPILPPLTWTILDMENVPPLLNPNLKNKSFILNFKSLEDLYHVLEPL